LALIATSNFECANVIGAHHVGNIQSVMGVNTHVAESETKCNVAGGSLRVNAMTE